VTQIAHADPDVETFRFMSFVIRDAAPSVQEAKDFYHGKKSLPQFIDQWMTGEEHQSRVQRYFRDMFGMEKGTFIAQDEFDLILSNLTANPALSPSDLAANGVYHLPVSVKSTCGTPISASAWWSDTPITICSNSASATLQFDGGATRCTGLDGNGLFNPQCGCGPEQIACYPQAFKYKTMIGVTEEFPVRALHSYKNSQSWLDLFGGETFYGDRWLYHHYLYQSKVLTSSIAPSANEIAILKSLPAPQSELDFTKAEAVYPPDSATRSGVATAPSFLRRFNNFRSRIRALTERLLCKDIDATLNTDGIAQFVNTDLSDFDKAHGTKAGCASCHYGMDNFGSTLLGWITDGFYMSWQPPSDAGHVFGLNGNGPEFLMRGYVERANGFTECMAKTAWEDFSGSPWNSLGSADQSAFVQAAASGPNATITSILRSEALLRLRHRELAEIKTTVDVKYSFSQDIQPILTNKCSGSSCHSQGTILGANYEFVDGEERFRGIPAQRITDGSMPPPSAGKTLDSDEQDKILIWLNQ
jgi:hypothetical protein